MKLFSKILIGCLSTIIVILIIHVFLFKLNNKKIINLNIELTKQNIEYSIVYKNLLSDNRELRKNKDVLQNQNELLRRITNTDVIIDGITVTMYNPTEEQCDESPGITASGAKINIENASNHKWIAVSPELLRRNGGPLRFNDQVYLYSGEHTKSGIYTINDVMNHKWLNRIDILETEGTKLYKFEKCTLYKLDKKYGI